MPRLLNAKTFIQFFELDKDNVTTGFSEDAAWKWLLQNWDITESLRKWAEENYPTAPPVYHCCFAGLIAYFATGRYGGYGTVEVKKERYSEYKAYEFYTRLHEMLSPEQMTIVLIYFVISHLLEKSPMEVETEKKIKEAIELLEKSKKSFKSRQVADARKILESI